MARPARPWFRFYVEAMRDPKMRRLAPAQRWLWVAVLSAARESCRPGYLLVADGVPYNVDDLADYAGMKPKDVEVGIGRLLELGMLTDDAATDAWMIPRWDERQYESDSSRVRTAKWRRGDAGSDVTVTAVVTPPYTETEAEAEEPLAPAGRALAVARPRDPIWEALISAWGLDGRELTRTERDRINAAAKQLRDIGADPAEIPARKQMFQIQWPTITATMHAVVGRWAECRPDLSRLQGKAPRATASIARAVAKGSP